jgi:hypothetical protein
VAHQRVVREQGAAWEPAALRPTQDLMPFSPPVGRVARSADPAELELQEAGPRKAGEASEDRPIRLRAADRWLGWPVLHREAGRVPEVCRVPVASSEAVEWEWQESDLVAQEPEGPQLAGLEQVEPPR